MAPSWLSIGLDVWRRADMNFDRDYCLPLPRSDWEGVRKCMADYGDVAGLTKLLLQKLSMGGINNQQLQGTKQFQRQ